MTDAALSSGLNLLERLAAGPVICAEGYLFEIERRGYLSAGAYVPEAVVDHPEVVAQLHRDFLHAGSDVMLAFTYYAHREKLRVIGREDSLEEMNRTALRLAREAAQGSDALVAGNVSNSNTYVEGDAESARDVRAMFDEQVAWAVDEGVDYIVAETISFVGEALLALEAIKAAGQTAVINLAVHRDPITRDGLSMAEAAKRLEDAGADVVGLNCTRGPATMLPLLGPIREAVSCHVAALPVAYRTTAEQPSFQSLEDPDCACLPRERPFPTALDPFTVNRYEIEEFTRDAQALGVNYLGVCCGASPHHIRSMAEALGRRPPGSRYSPDMSTHAFYGTSDKVPSRYKDFAKHL
ncbi:MAG: homocysteine S-methyltransferase family protein [Rhodospirillaceae bacterium]|nr:homocysteine S-methyltransferase family protein [Rhodospirillaceae bacterium]